MYQKEFNELTKQQIAEISKEGSDCEECFKFGYMYAMNEIRQLMESSEDNFDFCDKLEATLSQAYNLHEY